MKTLAGSPLEEPADLREGETLGGRYRLDALRGEGAFGRVYEGFDQALGRRVAVKFLQAGRADARARARLRREGEVLARLQHPNIVAVFDAGESRGELYLVMELVAGVTLGEALLPPAPLAAFPRLAAVLDQVLQGLEAAHAAGVIHRDLKPENAMLLPEPDGTERVKVLDFGLAMVDDPAVPRLTSTLAIAGTPAYMSPEQCRGMEVGPASDVYAWGALLYALLTGTPPFSGPTAPEFMAQHLYVTPPPMAERSLRPVPPALEALARAALAKRAADRPSASELRAALAQAMAGEDPLTRAAKAAQERIGSKGKARAERALPAPEPVVEVPRAQGTAWLWALADGPAARLRNELAVHGVEARVWMHESPPEDPGMVVLEAGEKAASRLRALRALPAGGPPALVLGLESVGEAPELIRAGASDLAFRVGAR